MESVLLYLITHMTSCKREVARSLQTAHTAVCRDLATSRLHDVICVIKYNSTDSINDSFVTMDMTVYAFHSWQDLRKPLYNIKSKRGSYHHVGVAKQRMKKGR